MEELQYLSHLLADNFKHSLRRNDQTQRPFELETAPAVEPVRIEGAEERAAVAAGTLLLLLIGERGGTALPRGSLLRLAQQALDGFPGSGKAQILDEVTRIMDWLADALLDKSEGIDPQSWGDVHYEVGPYLTLVRQALACKEDLELEYFSYNRGEWSTRRVTPTRLEGRTTLVGHCHLRGKERRFRLSRIRCLQLVGGSAEELDRDRDRNREREQPAARRRR